MTQTHDLKTHPDPFNDVIRKLKPFEYRWNDRNFQVGDILHLREYNPAAAMHTGRSAIVHVTYILHGGKYGIPEGYCIMGIRFVWMPSKQYSQEYRQWGIVEACRQIILPEGCGC